MGQWRKLGRVYQPVAKGPLLASHAANPVALHLDGDVFRVFYSGRDGQNRSSVGAVDIDIVQARVVQDHAGVQFAYGGPQTCHPDGVSIGCHFRAGGLHRMLFMGWQIPNGGHWRGDIGQLQIAGDLSLHPVADDLFLGTDADFDPVSLSYPWVMQRGGLWHMWYGSTVTWQTENGEMLHVINHATSEDGLHWQRHGQAVPHALGVAQAFSRPSVAEDADGLHMWFSYRSGTGQSYRIGYAHSVDGAGWVLALDRAGIDVSAQGWDSEMICYPYVFDHAGRRWMLYNGNGFGASGFGLAVLDV
jgi:hypothetical protein